MIFSLIDLIYQKKTATRIIFLQKRYMNDMFILILDSTVYIKRRRPEKIPWKLSAAGLCLVELEAAAVSLSWNEIPLVFACLFSFGRFYCTSI